MKIFKLIISLVVALLLISCSTLSLRRNVGADYDEATGVTTYTGAESNEIEYTTDKPFASVTAKFYLRTFIGENTNHQLIVKTMYNGSDWPEFSSAAAEDGTELEFTKIGSDLNKFSRSSQIYTEVFGLNIPDEMIKNQSTGFKIKIYSESGIEVTVFIDEMMIANQFQAISKE